MKNINIQKIIEKTEVYKLDNKDVPYLMREYPYLHEFAVRLLDKDISLIMEEERKDNLYFLLATLATHSVVHDKTGQFMTFYDKLTFFKKLEEVLIWNLGLSEVISILFSKRYNRIKKYEKIKKYKGILLLKELIEKDFKQKIDLKGLFHIKSSNTPLYSIEETHRIFSFCRKLND